MLHRMEVCGTRAETAIVDHGCLHPFHFAPKCVTSFKLFQVHSVEVGDGGVLLLHNMHNNVFQARDATRWRMFLTFVAMGAR